MLKLQGTLDAVCQNLQVRTDNAMVAELQAQIAFKNVSIERMSHGYDQMLSIHKDQAKDLYKLR